MSAQHPQNQLQNKRLTIKFDKKWCQKNSSKMYSTYISEERVQCKTHS